jgi:RNA polymerase sigma factor (TIGR02999 family)
VLTEPDKPRETLLHLTLLLNRMRQGDPAAGDKAVAVVYDELHRIAEREMRRERPGHALQATALINEVYVRLISAGSLEIQNRGHFFAVASQQMRRILVDHARSNNAQRRGGGATMVDLENLRLGTTERSIDVLLLDESLRELEKLDPRAARVVELRFFGGHTDKEVVEALGVSLATVRRDWEFARSWLFNRMRGQGESGPAQKS